MPRRPFDHYETPPHYLKALESVLEIPDKTFTIDPCVGDGAIADWLHNIYGASVVTNDIDMTRTATFHMDARDPRLYQKCKSTFWVTNPPFDCIDEILTTALAEVENVITLARLSVLEPTQARRAIYKWYQPDMLIVLPRYCFRLNDQGKRSTDSVTCCWLGFGPAVPQIMTVWTEKPPTEAKDKKR